MANSFDDLEYQLRVAAEEIDMMRDEIALGNLPHIKIFLQRPAVRWVLDRIQEFCWTVETVHRAWRGRRSAIEPAKGPSLPPTSRAAAYPSPIWIDVTNSYRSGFKGGVARVAMKLAESAARTGVARPVVVKNSEIYCYSEVEAGGAPLGITQDTIFVLVDTFWKPYDEYMQAIDRIATLGGRSVLCVHDVIALDYPLFFDIAFINAFRSRLCGMLHKVDACMTVSNYTLRQVRARFDDPIVANMPMSSFRLGADFTQATKADGELRPEIKDALRHPKTFISVGTMEPRKGYVLSLDAFERLWARGFDCRLLIFGQRGWICRALEKRIVDHVEFGRRLFWFQDSSDAELSVAYRTAYCLIQASIVEGFGLPIIEACREGTPVIASDAEIFREVGQDKLVYFQTLDSDDLARTIQSVMEARPVLEPLDISSWDDCLRDLVGNIGRLLPPKSV